MEVAAGDPSLADAAVRAVKQWKYQPYVVDGQPVQSQTRITVRFTMPSP
ncbi:MAG: energy transducer TonB [Candidatus Sulfotelmatobacter sp.]